MVLINYATKEIVAKIVYYGPALCGKTTNLQYIYTKLSPKKRGKMISLSTESDRTLFFDFLPMELGKIQGFKVRFQLYTVPGQVFYSATRKLVLKGADAVVFVADSQEAVLDMNIESLDDMKMNLIENNLDPESIPIVIQYNKRDLNGIMEVDELEKHLNWRGVPHTEAVAITGPGVMDTFLEITKALIQDLKKKHAVIDSDAIKELPPDIFEQEKEKEEDVLEAEDIVFEIEHGSGYRDETEEAEVVAGEMLDIVETISLADATLAEEFFDDVRKGIPTDEAREKVLSAVPADEKIELSAATEAEEVTGQETAVMESPLRVGERELTPDELEFAGESMPEEEAPEAAGVAEAAELEAEPYVEPVLAAAEEKPGPEPQPKARAKTKPTGKARAEKPAQAAEEGPQPESGKRFSEIQDSLARLAMDVTRLGGRLEKQAVQPPPAPQAPPDKRIDAILETLTHMAKEMAQLGSRMDNLPAAGPSQSAAPDLTPEIGDIKDSLGRVEQEISALRLTLTMMKESTANAIQAAQPSGSPELRAEFEELKKLVKDASEGQDRLLLAILEAARESKQANTDAHEKLDDALRYIAGNVKGEPGKKKWF